MSSKFYWLKSSNHPMAEASLGVYGAVIGVGIVLAVLAFTLRQRRPHGPDELIFDKKTA